MQRSARVGLGTLTALCTLTAVVVLLGAGGQQMFSPGELNAQSRWGEPVGGVMTHAQLSNNCAACHAPPWGNETMADRCLTCHTDVRAQIEQRRALHGRMPDGRDCRSCHTEHQGTHAALTRLDGFDHDWAAFKLTGKHRAVDCKTCHTNNVYKNTPQTCVSCHAEPPVHKGRFGTDCAACHSTARWGVELANLSDFNHDLTAFRLTGKHRAIDCKLCHTNNVYKGTPQTCHACHGEPQVHKGKYGTNCTTCHTTGGWDEIIFRHSFPTNHAGALKKGGCAICHPTPARFEEYTCSNCHRHNLAQTAKKHLKYGVTNVTPCADCHPQGRRTKSKGRTAAEEPAALMACAGEAEPLCAFHGSPSGNLCPVGAPSSGSESRQVLVDYFLAPPASRETRSAALTTTPPRHHRVLDLRDVFSPRPGGSSFVP